MSLAPPDSADLKSRDATTFELNVLFSDDAIVCVNKPANILSVPGKGERGQICVSNRVLVQFPDAKVVHRLDMATSGIMIFALGKANQVHLNKQFEQRRVEKIYDAVVKGHLTADVGEVNVPLMADWPNRPKQKICFREGKSALTRYRLVSRERLTNPAIKNKNVGATPVTRIQLMPITGRSHQLRMHMLAIGHPIVGDEFYTDKSTNMLSTRLLLHARVLMLAHPQTDTILRIVAPTPF